MAIEQRTVTTTLFWLRCDICGARAPEAESQGEALLLADEEGYRLYSRMGGLDGRDLLLEALCESCQGIWESEGKYGQMERVRGPEELAGLLDIHQEEEESYDFLCPDCLIAGSLTEDEDGREMWFCGRCGRTWPAEK